MIRLIALACVVVVAAIGASGAGASTVYHGYRCTIGLPTPDNQGVLFTTTTDVLVLSNGALVTHCTFTGTGYTPPANPFPFNCFIGPDNTPADITELHMSPSGTVVLTCVAKP